MRTFDVITGRVRTWAVPGAVNPNVSTVHTRRHVFVDKWSDGYTHRYAIDLTRQVVAAHDPLPVCACTVLVLWPSTALAQGEDSEWATGSGGHFAFLAQDEANVSVLRVVAPGGVVSGPEIVSEPVRRSHRCRRPARGRAGRLDRRGRRGVARALPAAGRSARAGRDRRAAEGGVRCRGRGRRHRRGRQRDGHLVAGAPRRTRRDVGPHALGGGRLGRRAEPGRLPGLRPVARRSPRTAARSWRGGRRGPQSTRTSIRQRSARARPLACSRRPECS